MEDHRPSLAAAGIFMSITAALHLSAILVTGIHFSAIFLLLIGAMYAIIALSFLSNADDFARFTFYFMFIGMAGAQIMIWMHMAVPFWWLKLIIWADLLVALTLLWYLLRR